jgi:hypothetical protein
MSDSSKVGWNDAPKVPRRAFLIGSAAVVGAGGAGAVAVTVGAQRTPHPNSDLRAVCMAMHVHASASEGPGSMEAQLTQATKCGVDVLWWTEHDFRMSAHDAAQLVRCSGMLEDTADVIKWRWTPIGFGKASSRIRAFVTPATHPQLGDRDHAMQLGVTAAGSNLTRNVMSGQSANLLNRTSLAGQIVEVDVFPTHVTQSSYLAIELTTSFRPTHADVPADVYTISYRVGGPQMPGVSVLVDPTGAAVTLDALVGKWTTVRLTPAADLSRIWPGIDGDDASLFRFALVAAARGKGKVGGGYFANVRFSRDASGQRPLATQRRLMTYYEDRFPTVQQVQAVEVSLTTPHLGWYGGHIALPNYTGDGPNPSQDEDVALAAVGKIHAAGGVASYCHPFGTAVGELSATLQETARAAKCTELVTNRALGCDLLEVGYRLRGGCNLAQHESVWDNCSRNEIFLTGVGVSDDHKGQNWSGALLNFVTWAWARDTKLSSLIHALRRGRVYFGDVAKFNGQLDMHMNGVPAMGTVSVSSKAKRTISILASGLPSGSTVEVWRGLVDLAGADDTEPKRTSQTIDASAFAASNDETSIDVDTSVSCFVRLVVKDKDDLPVAFSNPVWLLRHKPEHGLPSARRLAG